MTWPSGCPASVATEIVVCPLSPRVKNVRPFTTDCSPDGGFWSYMITSLPTNESGCSSSSPCWAIVTAEGLVPWTVQPSGTLPNV